MCVCLHLNLVTEKKIVNLKKSSNSKHGYCW